MSCIIGVIIWIKATIWHFSAMCIYDQTEGSGEYCISTWYTIDKCAKIVKFIINVFNMKLRASIKDSPSSCSEISKQFASRGVFQNHEHVGFILVYCVSGEIDTILSKCFTG